MKYLILFFVAWVAIGTGVYFLFSPIWLVAYGFGSMAGVLLWAETRKPGNTGTPTPLA